jgi:hypothetical protein
MIVLSELPYRLGETATSTTHRHHPATHPRYHPPRYYPTSLPLHYHLTITSPRYHLTTTSLPRYHLTSKKQIPPQAVVKVDRI